MQKTKMPKIVNNNTPPTTQMRIPHQGKGVLQPLESIDTKTLKTFVVRPTCVDALRQSFGCDSTMSELDRLVEQLES